MKFEWNGVFPAVTTKFKENEDLDLALFQKNIQAQMDAGVNGIVLGGTLGEASTLENSEKLDLLAATKEITANKIPVIVNIAEQRTKTAIRLAKESKENGADGFMLLPPMRYISDHKETVSYFSEIADSTDLPIMIYNNPVDYKIHVTIDMFKELVKHDNISAVKESTRDTGNITRMKNEFGDRIKILCGVDTIALESIAIGADGWVAGLVCAFPKETVTIYDLVKEGKLEEATKIFRWFFPLLELDINTKLVQNIKLAEQMVDLGSEHVRKPRLPLEGEERKQVLAVIEESLKRRPKL